MQHNWDDLRVFLALARADSLTQAGQRLRMDPATVGRRISRLEDALGFTLFRRSPQGYELSSEGERLFAETGDLDTRIAQATDLGQTRAGHLSGVVRIGAPDGCANFVLPQVCAAIGDAHPDLELQIVALPRILNLSKREADMAIAVSPPQTGRLVVQKVSEYQLHMVARDELRKSVQPIETVEDLKHQPIVGYIPEMIFDRELDYLSEMGLSHVRFASNSVSVQFHLVCQGAGFGIVHDFALPFGRDLVKILPDQIALARTFYLIRHADDQRSERLTRLARLIAQGVRAEVARLEALSL